MNPNKADKVDMDSVLSNIMQSGPNFPEPEQAVAQPQSRPEIKPTARPFNPAPTHTPTPTPYVALKHSEPLAMPLPERTKQSGGFKKRYIVMPILIIALGLGGFFLKQPIASLMAPPSPFSEQLIQNIGFPLYYPTKLPSGFKIELNSIEASSGVAVYVISDDSGKIISLSLQEQLESLSLDSAVQSLKATENTRKLITPVGEAAIGINKEEARQFISVLTGKTWILINTPENTLSDADLDLILNSLKQASS